MKALTRGDFLRWGVATAAIPTLLELSAYKALAAKKPLAPAIDLKTLVQKAQAEGGTCLAYFASADLATGFSSGFKTAYPWATANTVVASTGNTLSRVLTEYAAGGHGGADVTISAVAQEWVLIRSGAVAPVALANTANLPVAFRDLTGYRHPYAVVIGTLISNPNLASYVPTDIFQLSKPAYKGQLAFDQPSNLGISSIFLASHRKAWGDKKWMQWLQGLHDNNVFVTASGSSTFAAVLAGERGIGVDQIADVLSAPTGAPIKADFYSGAGPNVNPVMMTSYASNPYTAQLFMNWIESPAGQQVVVTTGRSPAVDVPGAATSVSKLVPKGFPIAPYSDIAGFVYNPQPYLKIWNQFWPS